MMTAKAEASMAAPSASTRSVMSRARSQLVNSTMIEPTLTVAMLKSTILASIRAIIFASIVADSCIRVVHITKKIIIRKLLFFLA